MAELSLDGLTKAFDGQVAVDDVTLKIGSGEFFSVLGPSGCGKTTLLRLIAGLELPDSGKIFLDGKPIEGKSPKERGIGMVFQNYALFPHMTVAQNIAFGLEGRNQTKGEIEQKVDQILDAVRLMHRKTYRASDLSGGEQQRVAVGRAVVVEPAVLLFDEPLSNLDVALRASTREEIKILQQRTGITTIYVTHDQAEALSLSDRIAVMRGGKVQQVGPPAGIYGKPESPFVAEFLGTAAIVQGTIRNGSLSFGSLQHPVTLPAGIGKGIVDDRCTVAIKPEHVLPLSEATDDSLEGTVAAVEFHGFTTSLLLSVSEINLRSTILTSTLTSLPVAGSKIPVRIDWERCTFFDGQ